MEREGQIELSVWSGVDCRSRSKLDASGRLGLEEKRHCSGQYCCSTDREDYEGRLTEWITSGAISKFGPRISTRI